MTSLVLVLGVGTTLHAFADSSVDEQTFVVPEGVFSANYLRDVDGVAVIEFSGDYNKSDAGGHPNAVARAVVAREFYRNNPDNFDFLVVFTSFEFDTGQATAFHTGVSNNVQGIGLPIYSNADIYGSSGELKGFIDMAALSRYESNPLTALSTQNAANFDDALKTLSHETLHQWAAHTDIPALQGKDDGHWSFFLDTEGSLEYGHDWRDNQDGSFTAVKARSVYSPLDLYLMGMHGSDQVPDMFVINPDDDTYSAGDLPEPGITISGSRQDITIQDFVSVHGAREPTADDATKTARYAFIYLTPLGGPADNIEIAKINQIRKAFSERFSILTGGKGIAVVYPQVKVLSAGGSLNELSSITDQKNVSADLVGALDWLASQQYSDGHWQDRQSTSIRDTQTVYSVMKEFRPDYPGLGTAGDWVADSTPDNTDSRARALRVTPNRTAWAQELSAQQNTDGGWGISNRFASSVLDTALVMCALAQQSGHSQQLDKATEYIYQMQNADGGWGSISHSGSSISASARVLRALRCAVRDDDRAAQGIIMLANSVNLDGGFGDGQSSVHETASVLLTMLAFGEGDLIDYAAALDFIDQRQSITGDWKGSVYTTALAARALLSARLPNLAARSIETLNTVIHDGDYVQLETTLSNDSRDPLPSSILRLYLGDPAAGGVEFAQANVPALPPFASVAVRSVWDSYLHNGSNPIYAVADADGQITERTETDNLVSTEVFVATPPNGVELAVSDHEFIVEPSHVLTLPSQQNLLATIRNLGSSSADSVLVELWRGDPQLGGELLETRQINIAGRSSEPLSFSYRLIHPGRTLFTLRLDADHQFTEINENNNSAVSELTTVDGIDLEVLPADINVSAMPVYLGQDATVGITIRNKGTTATPDSSLLVSLRNTGGETELLNTQVNLQPGEEKTFSSAWRADFSGASEVVVRLDEQNLVAEIDESNNAASGTINANLAQGKNLTVNFSEFSANPDPGREGLSAILTATIRNTGTVDVNNAQIAFYDGNPADGGVLIGTTIIPSLTSAQAQVAQVSWTSIPDASTRFVYVVADSNQAIDELNEADNIAFTKLMVLSQPDLAISSQSIQSAPTFPNVNQIAQFSILLTNRGMQAVQGARVIAHAGQDSAAPVIASTTLDIDASADAIWNFEHSFSQQGEHEIHVIVDPEQLIEESSENNNTATRRFVVQDGEFYLSDRFVSPDGNGIKDTVSYFFTLPQADKVSVVVINQLEKEVAELPVADQAIASGTVEWDGKNSFGGLVADGEYLFAVKDTAGNYQGQRRVSLDTNRSPVADAIDTEFALTRNLTCRIGEVLQVYDHRDFVEVPDTQNILYGPDDQFIYFVTYFEPSSGPDGEPVRTDEKVRFPSGIYRALADGSNVVQLVSDQEMPIGGRSDIGVHSFNISPDGSRLAFLIGERVVSSEFGLWTVGTDGTGLQKITDIADINYSGEVISDLQFINERELIYLTRRTSETGDSQIWKIQDVENAVPEKIFDLAESSQQGSIWSLEPNKSRSHLLLKLAETRDGSGGGGISISFDLLDLVGGYSLGLLEIQTGQYIEVSDHTDSHAWSPDGNRFALADPALQEIQIYRLDGSLQSSFLFPYRQDAVFSGAEANAFYDFLGSLSQQASLEQDSLVGAFAELTWNPDGSQLVFAVQDYLASVIHSDGCSISSSNSVDEICFNPPVQIQPLLDRYSSLDGLYLLDLLSARTELVARTSTINASYANVSLIFCDGFCLDIYPQSPFISPNGVDLGTNQYGLPITLDGYPYVVWAGTAWALDSHVDFNREVSYGDRSKSRRTLRWLDGGRELLITGGDRFLPELSPGSTLADFEGSRDEGVTPTNQTVLLNLDEPGQSRAVFSERNLEFPISHVQRRGVYPTNTGQLFSFLSDDEPDACTDNGESQGYRQFQSLLNMVADLRVHRSSREGGFVLNGTATDRNLDHYHLEYADASTPEQWVSIAPPSGIQVIDDRFTTWVAPYVGSFLVRLTVVDEAGNQRRNIQRVSNAERPLISSVYLTPAHFSPNGDEINDSASLHFRVLEPINLVLNIYSEEGALVRTITQSYDVIGSEHNISWNGRNDAGELLADGKYRFEVEGYEFFTELDNTAPVLVDHTAALFQPRHLDFPRESCDFNVGELIPESVGDEFLKNCRVITDGSIRGEVEENNLQYFRLESRPHGSQGWLSEETSGLHPAQTLRYGVSIPEWRHAEFRYVAADLAGNTSVLVVDSGKKQNKAHFILYKPGADSIATGFGFESNSDYGIRQGYRYPINDAPDRFRLSFAHTLTESVQFTELLYRALGSDAPYKSINLDLSDSIDKAGQSFFFDTGLLEPVAGGNYETRVRLRGSSGAVLDTNSLALQLDWRVYTMPYSTCGPGLLPCGLIPQPNRLVASPVVDAGTNIPPAEIDRVVVFLKSVGPKEDRRYMEDETLVLTDTSQLANGATRVQTYSFTPGGQIIVDDLAPSLRRGRDADPAEDIYRVEFLRDESLRTIGDCGFAYELRGLVFHHGSFEPKIFTFGETGPCLEIELDVDPVFAEQCDATPTHTAEVSVFLRSELSEATGTGDIVDVVGGSAVKPIFFQIGSPAVDAAGEEAVINPVVVENFPSLFTVFSYQIDTSALPQGELPMRILVRFEDGRQQIKDFVLPVVHQAPTLDLTFPTSGQAICATEYQTSVGEAGFPDSSRKGVEVQGELTSFGPDAALEVPDATKPHPALLSHRYVNGSSKPLFESIKRQNLNNYLVEESLTGSFLGRHRVSDGGLVNTADIAFNPRNMKLQASGVLTIPIVDGSGELNARLQASNWSGARVCRDLTVHVDAEIDGLNLAWSGAKVIQDRVYGELGLIAPGTDDGYNTLHLQHFADEAVVFDMAVYAAQVDSESGEIVNGEKVIQLHENESLVAQGNNQFSWGGTDESGNPVVDGVYRVVVDSRDGCGNRDAQAYLVGVDTTAPALQITQPDENTPVGLQLRVLGSVTDAHPGTYQLFITTAAADFVLLDSADGNIDGLLGEWNSFGSVGTRQLRLSAVDAVGNRSIIEQDFIVPPRQQLISSHTTGDYLFSPNGDGRLDTVAIRTSFDTDVVADIQVYDESGGLVKTLVSNENYSAGFVTTIWDGSRDVGGIAVDGLYTARVTAAANGNLQSEDVSFELDNTAPELLLDDLNAGYIESALAGQIMGQISDRNIQDYQVNLRSVAETQGTPLLPLFTQIASHTGQVLGLLAELPLHLLDQEQEYEVQFLLRDKAGNQLQSNARLLIDPVPPDILIVAPQTASILSARASPLLISGHVRDSHLRDYQVSFAPVGNPENSTQIFEGFIVTEHEIAFWDLTGLDDGDYVITVTATDKGGLRSSASVAVTIDNQAPDIAINEPLKNGFISDLLPIVGVANDANFAQYTLAIASGNVQQGGVFQNLTSSNRPVMDAVLFNWAQLPADGIHTLRMSANDAAGNSTTLYHLFNVDTTPPVQPVLSSVELLGTSKVDVEIVWEASSANDLAGYDLYRDGVKINSELLTATRYQDANLEDGHHTYAVRAIDQASLQSLPSNAMGIRIDTAPPSAFINTPVENQSVSLLVDILGVAYSENDFKEYRLLAGPTAGSLQLLQSSTLPIQSGQLAQWDTTSLQDGARYVLRLEAEDINGNQASDQVEVIIDNTAPEAPINLQAILINGNDGQLGWQQDVPAADLQGYLLYRNDRLINTSEAVIGDLRPYAITGLDFTDAELPDGEFRYQVYAIDQSGNVSLPSNEAQLSLNRHPPQAVISNIEPNQEFDASLEIIVETPDRDIQQIELQYRMPDPGAAWNSLVTFEAEPYQFLWDTTALPLANYELRAVATDISGLVDPNPAVVSAVKRDLTAPAAPQDLVISVDGDIGSLSWAANSEPDLSGYHIYRVGDHCADCNLNSFDRLTGSPLQADSYQDSINYDEDFIYLVIAIDEAGNQSPESVRVTGIYTNTVVSQNQYVVDAASEPLTVSLTRQGLEFDTVREHKTLPDGTPVTTQMDLSTALTSTVVVPVLTTQGVYSFEIAAGSNSAQFIARPADTNVVVSGKPSVPGGLTIELDSISDEIVLNWEANPASEHVVAYQVFRDGIPLSAQLLIDDASATASAGTGINNTLPQVSDTSGWRSGFRPGVVSIDQSWAEPQRVGRLELDWASLQQSAKEYSIFARIEGEYVQVAQYSPDAQADPIEHVIELPVAIATDSIRVRIDNWYNRFGGGHLLKLRVFADRLVSTQQSFRELLGDGVYQYSLKAINAFGGISNLAPEVSISYGDVTPPQAPVLTGSATGGDATLNWPAVSDADSYHLYRDGQFLLQLAVLQYIDVGLLNGRYSYHVRAIDVAGNESLDSNIETVLIDVAPPAAPNNLQAVANDTSSTVELNWQSDDAIPPAGFRVYRSEQSSGEFSAIAETDQRMFVDSNVARQIQYYYQVVALDALGNESAPSNTVSALLLDITAPAKPFIKIPTDASEQYIAGEPGTDIAGLAEPGSLLYLIHQGVVLQQSAIASAQPIQTNMDYGAHGGFDRFVSLADGRVLAVWHENNGPELLLYFNHGIWRALPTNGMFETYDIRALRLVDQQTVLVDTYNGTFVIDPENNSVAAFDIALPDNMQLRRVEGLSLVNNSLLVYASIDYGSAQLFHQDLQSGVITAVTANEYRVSPDALFVAYGATSGSGETELFVFDVEQGTHSSTVIAQTSPIVLFANTQVWSPDSRRLMVAASLPDGRWQTLLFDLSLAGIGSVEHSTASIAGAVWHGIGGVFYSIVDALDNSTRLFSFELSSALTTELDGIDSPGSGPVELLTADRNQQLILRDQSTAQYFRYSPAGIFHFPDVSLEEGDNYFSVVAVDAGSNLSEPADSVVVVYAAEVLPDLALDMQINPVFPVIDNSSNIELMINNVGQGNSEPASLIVTIIDPEGKRHELENQLLGSMVADSSLRLDIGWSPQLAGAHTVIAALDPFDDIQELSEANNTRISNVAVAHEALPFVRLQLADSSVGNHQFGANQIVTGTVNVVNAGEQFTGFLQLQIVDAGNTLVADLGTHPVTNLAYGAQIDFDYQWNTAGNAAGNYRVIAELLNLTSSRVAFEQFGFEIVDTLSASLALRSDGFSYQPGQEALFTATATNLANSLILQNAEITLQIVAPDGSLAHQASQSLLELLPGEDSALRFNWNTAGNPAGIYTINSALINASGELAESQANIQVLFDQAGLQGALLLPGDVLTQGQNLDFDSSISNQGNSDLADITVNYRLSGEVAEVAAQSEEVAVLRIGQQQLSSQQFGAHLLPPGSYRLQMLADLPQGNGGFVPLLLDQKLFTVIENVAPLVDIRVPQPNAIINSRKTRAQIRAVDDSGVRRVEARIEGQAWHSVSASLIDPGYYYMRLDDLTDGDYQMDASAMDNNDNSSNTVERRFTVDNTPPLVSFDNISPAQVFNAPITPQVSVVDLHLADTAVRLNGVPLQSGTVISKTGNYTLVVEALDLAGNATRSVVSFQLDIKASPPSPELLLADDVLNMSRGVWGTVNVLANDQFEDLQQIQISISQQPQSGSLVLASKGVYNYLPGLRFVGSDQFTYQVDDAVTGKSATATVRVDVAPSASCSRVPDHLTDSGQPVELPQWARTPGDSGSTPNYRIVIVGNSNAAAFVSGGEPEVSFPECSLRYTPKDKISSTVMVQYRVIDVRTNGTRYTSPIRTFKLAINSRLPGQAIIVPILDLLLLDEEQQ